MLILTIVLGLIGLGLVVVVHEFGHFVAARSLGVEVEAFSVGWGPKIAGFKKGGTEWRFSLLPLGGFCKMKGEDSFRQALEDKADVMPREPGSFYAAEPWKRIVIALSGPLVNVILAFIIFTCVSTFAYTTPTFSNRIVLLSEYKVAGATQNSYPANVAGLESGDRIVEANGKQITDFSDLLQQITLSANKVVPLVIDRDGQRLEKTVRPMLDKESGAGLIGVTYWADPIVGTVGSESAAHIGGLLPGDRIVSYNGQPIAHAAQFMALLQQQKPEQFTLTVQRGIATLTLPIVLSWNDKGTSNLGLGFKTETHTVQAASTFAGAIAEGYQQTVFTFDATFKGLASLFQGVDIFKALSGPARITYMVGLSATEGIQSSGSGGMAIPLNFLAFLSIGLFIMNLLPIPALDGGQILMFIVEAVRRRMIKPITIYRYQALGATFVLALLVIATIGDFIYFTGK